MKQIYSSGIITYAWVDDHIEYLLLHYVGGHWDLPKGKLEPGETKEQAAQRELFEETGLKAEIQPGFEESLSYEFKDYQGHAIKKTVYFFVGKTTKQAAVLSHEHKDYEWLPFEQAIHQLTFDNAKQVVTKAHQFLQKQ